MGRRIASAWIAYAHGDAPWPPYNDGAAVKVWGAGAGDRVLAQRDVDHEEWVRWDAMERFGLDKIWEVGQDMLESGPRAGEQARA